MKLGEGVKNFSPLNFYQSIGQHKLYAKKLANDPFVGLRVSTNDVHRSYDIGQPLSYHHHCAIFLRDTKKF